MTSDAPETKIVYNHRVACDGGESALGHPRIWLQIPEGQWLGDMPVLRLQICTQRLKQIFLTR